VAPTRWRPLSSMHHACYKLPEEGRRRPWRPIPSGTRSSLCGRSPRAAAPARSRCWSPRRRGASGTAACRARHGDGGAQVAALEIGRLEVQQAIQLAVKAAPMRCDRAVGEIGPPVPNRAGIHHGSDARGRTDAPRRACPAPAGDPTATPSAARRRESPSIRTCRASAPSM
jgi:hypothetical protein